MTGNWSITPGCPFPKSPPNEERRKPIGKVKNISYRWQAGDDLICRECRACCLWEGEIRFDLDELRRVADFLGIEERDCADKYFELTRDRRHLKTKETESGRCLFLGEDGCRIYAVRPRQCRTFPYRWQRPEKNLMRKCRLYRRLLTREEAGPPLSI